MRAKNALISGEASWPSSASSHRFSIVLICATNRASRRQIAAM